MTNYHNESVLLFSVFSLINITNQISFEINYVKQNKKLFIIIIIIIIQVKIETIIFKIK